MEKLRRNKQRDDAGQQRVGMRRLDSGTRFWKHEATDDGRDDRLARLLEPPVQVSDHQSEDHDPSVPALLPILIVMPRALHSSSARSMLGR